MVHPRPQPKSARTKDAVRKDFRRAEILDAARRVIAACGVDRTSVERIAQEAGMGKGTFYLYFDSKEELLLAAIEDLMTELLRNTQAAVQRARGARSKLLATVRVALEQAARHAELRQALVDEHSPFRGLPLDSATEVSRPIAAYRGIVERVIRLGIRSGELRSVPDEWASRALGGFIRASLLGPGRLDDVEDNAAMIVDLFLHGVATGDHG